jgi:hypothetical protein
MKKFILPLLAATAVSAFALPALAQPGWRGINERQRELDARIDRGVASRCLTRSEALRLRTEYQHIALLERQYRASGGVFTQFERQDLDRRMDQLNRDITRQCRDDDRRGAPGPLPGLPGTPWENINQRQARLDARIDRGVRRGCLARREAVRLRAEFRNIANLEATYRRSGGGLTMVERQDLDRRFDRLGADIRRQCNDGDGR